ncbi:uncharacterized protein [Physcomitrium patens]|uniref:IST1-like protein n=1 Tax=Physcomitrium patens TaxID=3218 RepID=A0A2K1JX79_PHYPA|nr:filaggrin-like isoform X1 [Physcomitrium patens]XP_024386660.1 filaggrin-like isoform X1 [Physcomitrium patens]PNR46128.1 hypothetical protein PHYPA_013247 [Physcomitrium patens]|eukprot:XP_024386659.1 filaggrin-like isoform X1 [Physcomitrella patens]
MKRMNSFLHKGFQAAKCKTQLRLGTSRIKLLRNKKGIKIASDKREVAELLRKGQESTARLRVEQVIREQNLIDAYDLVSLYAERIAAEISVIDSQKTCPPNLKEDISTLLFATSRCSELRDFADIRPMFLSKYGKEFVSAAEELRPGCGVNGRVIEKLSTCLATGELKLKVMKAIAAEYNVEWDPAPLEKEIREVPDDLLNGPTVFTSADTFRTMIDDLPSVPNHDPTLGFHSSSSSSTPWPDTFKAPSSGSFVEDKVDPVNKSRSVDNSQDTVRRSGPPSRKPPPRNPPKADDLDFEGGHLDMDLESREAQSRRNLRRESDIFPTPSSQERFIGEESRRNSIGVPREKSGRPHAKSAFRDVDEPALHEQRKHNRRMSQGAYVDDYGREHEPESDVSRRSDRSQNPRFDQYVEKGHMRKADVDKSSTRKPLLARSSVEEFNQSSENDAMLYAKTKSGFDTARSYQMRDEQDWVEDKNVRVSSRGGTEKTRSQYQDYYLEGGSSRGASNSEVSRNKESTRDTSAEGGYNKFNSKSRESSKFTGNYQRPEYPDEDAGHVSPRFEDSRRRDSINNTRKGELLDEDNCNPSWDNYPFAKTVTTRKSKNSKELRDSSKSSRRDSLNNTVKVMPLDDFSAHNSDDEEYAGKDNGVYTDDVRRKSNSTAVRLTDDDTYFNYNGHGLEKGLTSSAPCFDSSEEEDEEEHDPRGSATRNPKSMPRAKTTDTRFSDGSSESGEEYARKGNRRTPNLSSVGERRSNTLSFKNPEDMNAPLHETGSTKSRPVFDDFPRSVRTSSHSGYDDEAEDDDDYHHATNLRTVNESCHTERRMSLPGSVREKSKFLAGGSGDVSGSTGRTSGRRATVGPEDFRGSIFQETKDSPKSKYGDMGVRRQSDRHRESDRSIKFDDDRPTRFINSNSHTERDDDIPRVLRVGKQPILDDKDSPRGQSSPREKLPRFVSDSPSRDDELAQSTPRTRSKLQSVKTDPNPSVSPRESTMEHRRTQSAYVDNFPSTSGTPRSHLRQQPSENGMSPNQDGQPQSRPTFFKPPDLEDLIQMFGKKKRGV